MFNSDNDLYAWASNQLWVIKNTQSAPNDAFPLPAGRATYAFERLCQLLAPLLSTEGPPVEYERRLSNPEKPMRAPMREVQKEDKPKRRVSLTAREADVLKAIKADLKKDVSPTNRSIAERLGLKSPSSVNKAVNTLADLGYIEVIGTGRGQRLAIL